MMAFAVSCRVSQIKFESLCYNCILKKNSRFYSSNSNNPEVKVPGKLKSFFYSRYLNHLNSFDVQFKKSLPGAHKLYRLFKTGVLDFFKDAKEYYQVSSRIWSGAPLTHFTCKQLQLYQQMPEDLVKSAPLIISLPLPLVPYLIFPVAYYMYPQYLLCRHFWTEEQKVIFTVEDLESRYGHYQKIFHYLETHTPTIGNSYTRDNFINLLHQVKLGKVEVEPENILMFKDLFTTLPFGLSHLIERHKIHLWHLCRGLDISTRKSQIQQDLHLIHNTDLALQREGIDSMELVHLQQLGLKRGFNPYKVSEEELKKYLKKWLTISLSLEESSLGLLMYCPVLLNSLWLQQTRI